MDRDHASVGQPVADALRALKQAAVVPPVDPAREAALFAAFDEAHAAGEQPSTVLEPSRAGARWDRWLLAGLAAAVLLLAASLPAVRSGRHAPPPARSAAAAAASGPRDVRLGPPDDFVIIPGAASLPPMESGTLVRMDVPVSMLPSLGVTPPPGQAKAVTADLVVAQDGLPRAVRVVSP